MSNFLCALAVALASITGAAGAATITIDPGVVGTTFDEKNVQFSDLNGTIASGQNLSLDFVFPIGIDAIYRYDGIGTQELYGWAVRIQYSSGTTITGVPNTSNVRPIDASGNAVATYTGVITFYTPPGGPTLDSVHYGNYNTQYFTANLLAFQDTAYHGVSMDIRLLDFVEDDVVVTSGTFFFTTNGTGEFTDIFSTAPPPGCEPSGYRPPKCDPYNPTVVPLPASLPLLLAGIAGLGIWSRRKKA